MVSLAFVISFVVSAVAMLIGIVIFAEIEDGMIGTFGDSDIIIQNGTAGVITTTDLSVGCNVHSYQIKTANKSTVLSSVGADFGTAYTDGTPFSTIIASCKGLAHDPITGNWYGLFGEGGGSNTPALGQVDPITGVGTVFPIAFPKANNMAITSSGDIYISYGADSGIVPTISLLDKTTGEVVSSCTLGGTRGSLGWNWDSDTMWIERTTAYPFMTIQEVNPTTCALIGSPVITTAPANGQGAPHAFTYNTNDGLWYMTVQSSPYTINATTGVATSIGGGFGGNTRGWAFETVTEVESPPIYEGGTPETFTRADSIAMTVLAIIPITLFFGLFTLFNSRGVEI